MKVQNRKSLAPVRASCRNKIQSGILKTKHSSKTKLPISLLLPKQNATLFKAPNLSGLDRSDGISLWFFFVFPRRPPRRHSFKGLFSLGISSLTMMPDDKHIVGEIALSIAPLMAFGQKKSLLCGAEKMVQWSEQEKKRVLVSVRSILYSIFLN